MFLAVIEGKLLADDVYVLWVNDAWCHQFEGIRLLAVEGEDLEDLGALLASRDLRNHYAEISDMLKDHDHVIITNHGRGESVLINIEDYAKYEEFLHQRYVAEALAKAKQQAADPNTQWADHESVWETLSKQYDV